MSKSKAFLFVCLSFIFGIFLNSIIFIPQLILLNFLILGIFLISVFWTPTHPPPSRFHGPLYKKIAFSGFCILLFVFGIWKTQSAFLKIESAPTKNFFGKELTFIGKVIEEPKIGEKSIKLVILAEEIEGEKEKNFGKILIWAKRYSEYEYGDRLKIKGLLREPEVFEDFDYKHYLAKDGIYSLIYFPNIELIEKNSGNLVKGTLFTFKNKLNESLNKFLSPPQSGLMEALLFGDEEKISQTWKEKFNLTGTRHITAVSGMNITIITFLLLNFLLFLGLYRNQAFYFSIILILLYIFMIGFPTSAIRAGIMALLFLTAQHLGRLSTTSRIIVFAAAFMLFLNPLLLKFDVGFQLSFLATLGLIYLQPIFQDFLKRLPNFLSLKSNLSATLGAQVFTLPILIYNFGRIPLISPLPNIFILPILPLLTILGFILAFLGIIFQFFGWILSFPTWFLLTYILNVIEFFSKIPFSSLSFKNFSWIFLLVSYSILGIIIWRLQEMQKLKFLNY
ncbi:hypothetical protein AMJ49_00900 [Parcubacteria bacterium DG_74_2]|nr:MAG: hypothetical protein AMJ49_00900 [Parcubacteria bacterium DG_74_2]